MDILDYIFSKKYSDAHGAGAVDTVEENLDKVDFDNTLAGGLMINAYRQLVYQLENEEEDGAVCEYGSVTLTNTQSFPFNDSQVSVSLANTQPDTHYIVVPEITASTGNPGDVVVSDKLTNGFKLAFTGSASSVTVSYIVIGGMFE